MMQESRPAFDNKPDSGIPIDQDFRNETVRLEAKTISSKYQIYLTGLIENYDLSEQCKITLTNIVAASFDTNAILARNDSIEGRVLMLEIELNMGVIAMDESDIQNPGLLNITNTIVDAFKDFISPSLDGGVRKRLGIDKIEHHQSYSGLPPQQSGVEPRGFNRGPGR